MDRVLAAIVLVCAASFQGATAIAQSHQDVGVQSALKAEDTSGGLPALPTAPRGKSTVIGGSIRAVDPVRDQFTLKVFGGKTMKVLFDERTQVYRDGVKIPLRDLHSEDHASIQTVLDGTDIFALSIHMLSQSPAGDAQGQVLSYTPSTGELMVSSALSSDPIKLLVSSETSVKREGQGTFASAQSGLTDLVKGSLVAVKFVPDQRGRGIASQITIFAVPGSAVIFSGNVSSVDLYSGSLVLIDPRDDKSYQVFFDSSHLPMSHALHQGDRITVNANFDGSRYVASAVTAN